MLSNIIIVILISICIITMCTIKIYPFKMNLKKWTLLFIAFFYGLVFAIVFLCTYLDKNSQLNIEKLEQYGGLDFFVYFLSVIILIIGIIAGFKIKTRPHGLINENNEIFLDQSLEMKRNITYFSICMLALSIGSYYLYAMSYGGFIGLLDNTIAIRIGISTIYNKWSFLQKFGGFSTISAFCLFSVFIDKKVGKELRNVALLFWLLAQFFSFYVIYSQGGRGAMVNTLLVYIIAIGFNYKTDLWRAIQKHWEKFLLVPIVFLILNSVWKRTEVTNFFSFLSSGYTYLFSSFYVNIHNYSFRYFYDLLIMPIMFLPSSIYLRWGVSTANQFNTYLSQGGYKGTVVDNQMITGESTTGLLSFSYMQLSVLGVFFIGLIFGVCIKKWDNRIKKMEDGAFKNILYAYYIVYFVYNGVSGGDTSALIISNFPYFIFFFGFGIFNKFRITKR